MRAALLCVGILVGCGPAAKECTTTFSGNFTDSSTGTCPTLDTVLRFSLPAPTINSAATGFIEVSSPTLTSQSTPGDWSAVTTREPGCVYAAGRGAVPSGTFELKLTSTRPPHGTLEIVQYVHALTMTDCGRGDTETIRLEF